MNRYQSYKPSGIECIGDIPEHWEMFRFSHFGTFFKGSGIKKDEVKNEGIPCIRYGEIYTKYDRVVYNPLSFIDQETSQSSTQIKKGDILFTGSGETIKDIGKSLLYFGDEEVFVGGDIIVLRLKEGFHPLYLSYLMNSHFIQYQKSLMGRGEIIVHIYSKNLKEIKTPLPPLSEQIQIVQFLDVKTELIDKLIKCTDNRIELLKEKRLSLIQKVLLNDDIEKIRLKYVVDLINRPITEFGVTNYTRIGMYNWGRGIFKYEEELGSELGDSDFSFIKEGDLLLSGQFSWEGSVSIVESEFDNCIVSHRFHILKGKDNLVLNEYLWGYFTSQDGHSILNNNSNGFVGRNRPLNIGKLLKEKIPIPNLQIQNEIKNIVEIERKNKEYSVRLKTSLKEYRQSLISDVVSGKVKVTQ
jgi:type I restriction enzyme S subunit